MILLPRYIHPYTSINDVDVLLSVRRSYFFNNTNTSFQEGCQYSEYSKETSNLKCECSATKKKKIKKTMMKI